MKCLKAKCVVNHRIDGDTLLKGNEYFITDGDDSTTVTVHLTRNHRIIAPKRVFNTPDHEQVEMEFDHDMMWTNAMSTNTGDISAIMTDTSGILWINDFLDRKDKT